MLLAHFHYLNKGVLPFHMANKAEGRRELARAAELDDNQLNFIRHSSGLIQDPQRGRQARLSCTRIMNAHSVTAALMTHVRDNELLNHDLYWVSQLYEEAWRPGPVA